jgi:cytidine deaminase
MTLAAAQVFRPPPPGRGAVIVAAGGVAMAIDWAALRAAATEVAQRAYAPYSGLRVGAAGETSDGRVVVGCNVENASYGLTLCAECGLVSALHTVGGGSLAAVSVVSGDGQHLLPCGRCRQSMLVDTGAGPVELSRLLPSPFTQADLAAAVDDDD